MNQVTNIHRDQIVDIAVRLKFLQDLTRTEISRLIDLKTHLFVYAPDECLIRNGDNDDTLFILLTGKVGVYKDGNCLSTIYAGDCFGEISFITKAPRTADILAHEISIVIRLNQSTYQRLSSEIREKLKDSIIKKLVTRIEQMNKLCITLQSGDIPNEFGVLHPKTV